MPILHYSNYKRKTPLLRPQLKVQLILTNYFLSLNPKTTLYNSHPLQIQYFQTNYYQLMFYYTHSCKHNIFPSNKKNSNLRIRIIFNHLLYYNLYPNTRLNFNNIFFSHYINLIINQILQIILHKRRSTNPTIYNNPTHIRIKNKNTSFQIKHNLYYFRMRWIRNHLILISNLLPK